MGDRKNSLHAGSQFVGKIASEGYCCPWGYLKLCRARKEKRADMARWIGVKFRLMRHHYGLLRKGVHQCQGYSDCLRPVIEHIERGGDSSLNNPHRGEVRLDELEKLPDGDQHP